MAWRIPYCDGCSRDNPEWIMIKEEVWLSIANKKEILCIDCIEKKLNRRLTFSDLKPCEITNSILIGKRLADNERLILMKRITMANVNEPLMGKPISSIVWSGKSQDRIKVICCKCFQVTRKWICPTCGHHICISCKPKPPSKGGSWSHIKD